MLKAIVKSRRTKSTAGEETKNAAARSAADAKSQIARTFSALRKRSANMPKSGEVNVPKPMRSPNQSPQLPPPGNALTYGSRGTNQTGSIMKLRNSMLPNRTLLAAPPFISA